MPLNIQNISLINIGTLNASYVSTANYMFFMINNDYILIDGNYLTL